ncbi:MAG: DUF1854 domain-containing protein [Firmicutes bacterium]|nr:DUF1854 domain-containing protein [Bacillota bacterium]
MESRDLSDLTNIRYLDPEKAIFSITEGGLLTLQLGNEYFAKVDLHQAFPFSLENKYISVRDEEGKEIGIIKDLDVFSQQSREAVEKELAWRYYAPQITKIIDIKDEFGHRYWDVETNHGHRKFVTRGRDEGIYQITESRILIIDMTGNRYEIANYYQLDTKSLRLLEPFI